MASWVETRPCALAISLSLAALAVEMRYVWTWAGGGAGVVPGQLVRGDQRVIAAVEQERAV